MSERQKIKETYVFTEEDMLFEFSLDRTINILLKKRKELEDAGAFDITICPLLSDDGDLKYEIEWYRYASPEEQQNSEFWKQKDNEFIERKKLAELKAKFEADPLRKKNIEGSNEVHWGSDTTMNLGSLAYLNHEIKHLLKTLPDTQWFEIYVKSESKRSIRVTFTRPETEDEYKNRVAQSYPNGPEELALYEELKAKYEGKDEYRA